MRKTIQKNEKGDNVGRDKIINNIFVNGIFYSILIIIFIFSNTFREIIFFTLQGLLKHWYISFIAIGLIIYFRLFKPFIIGWFTLISFLLILLYDIYGLKNDPYRLCYLGTFYLDSNDNVTSYGKSNQINKNFEKYVSSINEDHVSFRQYNLSFKCQFFPPFLSSILGLNLTQRLIKSLTSQHGIVYYFTIDVQGNKTLEIELDDKTYQVQDHYSKLAIELNDISGLLSDSDFVVFSTYQIVSQFGHAIAVIFNSNSAYTISHIIVNDSKKCYNKSFELIKPKCTQENYQKIANNVTRSICAIEIEKANIFLQQNEYRFFIDHIFFALQYNLIYPFKSYSEFKRFYTNLYLKNINEDSKEIEAAGLVLYENVTFDMNDQEINCLPSIIILRNHAKEVINKGEGVYLEKKLNEIKAKFHADPVAWLIYADIIKGVPKGNKKIRDIYVQRFPEVIDALKRILDIDPDFEIINQRLVAFIMFNSVMQGKSLQSKYNSENRKYFEGMKKNYLELVD